MMRKNIFKLPIIEKTFILESKPPVSKDEGNEKILKENAQKAYQKGRDDALKDNQENMDLLCQSLKKAISELTLEKNNIMGKFEKTIIKLAIAIARKAVREEISQNSSKIIESVVKEALTKVKDKKILKVHLNPDDIGKLEQISDVGISLSGEDYEVVSDVDISRGGCRVITDCGGVDATMETCWYGIVSVFGEHGMETEEIEWQK
ncbi:MAG: hypothetical protein HOI47_10835 [Candidatus Scalindua sp.]|nr:hypothetical protein [Candidatus Scalindua sp.]MBT6227142.1 hypothetical protein [Candidatus Scalindua sp.]